MKRGHTLVEILLSLAILGAVMSGAAAWTQLAANAGFESIRRSRCINAVHAVMRLIQTDLDQGDFGQPIRSRAASPPRVQCQGSVLRMFTRAAGDNRGPVIHEVHFERMKGQIRLIETSALGRDAVQDRLLLGNVQSFECILDGESQVLTISIGVEGCDSVSRNWWLP